MKLHLTLLLSAAAGIAAAQGIPHNMVSRHTPVNTNLIGAVVGEGLSLSNGVLTATGGEGGGGGLSTNDVRAIIEADAGPTNRIVHADDVGDVTISGAMYATDVYLTGGVNASGDIAGNSVWVGDVHAGDKISGVGDLEVLGNAYVFGALTVGNNEVRSAAYRDASEFATATDEALVYQLLTNRLSGVTFDFATVAGLYLAISNIVAAQGGAITNFPAIP